MASFGSNDTSPAAAAAADSFVASDMAEESPLRSPLRKITANQSSQSGDESMRKRTKVDDGDDDDAPAAITLLDYPSDIAIPSRGLVQSYFNDAMEKPGGEQSLVSEFGLLSFQDVLLPIVAHQEERAVKSLQSIVQRDHPELTSAVVTCRKAILDSVHAGMQAAEMAREQRHLAEQDRETKWVEQRRLQEIQKQLDQEQRAKEEKQLSDMARLRAMGEARKHLAFNQDLYRENAYLLSEMPKLQKELKSWKQAEEELKKREAEIDALEKELAEKEAETSKKGTTAVLAPMNDQPMQEVETAIKGVKTSTLQIQILLENVCNIADESDKVRKELYRQYRQEHQFHGYQGASDPKGLLFALSQSQQSASSQDSDM